MLNKLRIETWAYLYGMLFFILIGLNFLSFLFREDGKLIGGFAFGDNANILHVLSGMWALTALWYSRNAILYYFKIFGTLYLLDDLVGLVVGKTFLNLNLFDPQIQAHGDMLTRIILTSPHIIIGGLAMLLGFIFYKKL